MSILPRKNLNWQPDRETFEAPLRKKRHYEDGLGRFQRGVDNAHIDVTLSPEFTRRARTYIRAACLHDAKEHSWQKSSTPPARSTIEALREGYANLMELAIDRVKKERREELIQLLQYAVWKFLLQEVREEVAGLKGRLQEASRLDDHQASGKALEIHQRLVSLARDEAAIRYRVCRRLFRELFHVESARLSKIRQSVLGTAWPVPVPYLFNPMLQLPSIWADEEVMKHYTLACTDKDDRDSFGRVNRLVTSLFEPFIPEWQRGLEPPVPVTTDSEGSELSSLKSRVDQGGLNGFLEVEIVIGRALQEAEYQAGRCSWLDSPTNVDRVIYSVEPRKANRFELAGKEIDPLWTDENWADFHHGLLQRLFAAFEEDGLEQRVLGAGAAPKVHEALGGEVPVRLICQFLGGSLPRRDLVRRLSSMKQVSDVHAATKVLDQALVGVKHMPPLNRRRRLISFLKEFAALRRDLKQAYLAHRAMDSIRLVEAPEEVALSRKNGALQEFLLREEATDHGQSIRNHVVIKADLRGSTRIIEKLREQGLNPASHFSQNFFEPIAELLPTFGAKKVFIEGDAIILSTFEFEHTPFQWLCVSHACGLAEKILQVVDRQNQKNGSNGLPELELGLGVAFCEEAPAFLYDGDQEIMISPAINRADRLSSCSNLLRRSGFARGLGRGVEVVAPAEGGLFECDGGAEFLRYNVNGIELDGAAFEKLCGELALKAVRLDTGSGAERYHAGRYPDIEGGMHWLVIREAPVRMLTDEGGLAPDPQKRRFYQVVTDREVVTRVTGEIGGARRAAPPGGH